MRGWAVLALLLELAGGPAVAQEPLPIWKACGTGVMDACTTIIDARLTLMDVYLALRVRAQASRHRVWPEVRSLAIHYNGRCWVRIALDEIDGAVADCTDALRLWPTSINALNGRGAAYLPNGSIQPPNSTSSTCGTWTSRLQRWGWGPDQPQELAILLCC